MATKPVFVVGTARSGTTWLANMLVSHPDLAGVTAAEHQGIHESHLFSHTRYVLTGRRTCHEFVELYQREDYFKLLRLDPRQLCENEEKIDVYGFFRMLMEKYAASQGAKYWLEKTPKHAIYYEDILDKYPDALFVIIQRSFEKTLLSNLNKFARPGVSRWRIIFEKVFRYESDMRAMTRLKKLARDRSVSIKYEDLLLNAGQEVDKILHFLEVPKIHLESAFPADSSFKNGTLVQFDLSPFEWFVIRIIRMIFTVIPLRTMRQVREKRDMSDTRNFPKFKIIKDREVL